VVNRNNNHLLLPLLPGPARVVHVSVGVLEAVVLVHEGDLVVLDQIGRVTRERPVGHLLLSRLAADRSLSDHQKVRFVFTFRKANVRRALVVSINTRS